MEYNIAQILYDEINRIREKFNQEIKSFRQLTSYFGIKLYHSDLDNNVLAFYTKKDDDYTIVVNNNINKYYELVSVYTLVSAIILYKKLNDEELLNLKIYKKGNKFKYSKIIKLFVIDIVFDQNNIEQFLKESREVNVQKK